MWFQRLWVQVPLVTLNKIIMTEFDETNDDQQQFIAEAENCTAEHKNFADVPFVIPQLSYQVIDKIMMGGNIEGSEDTYKKDYSIVGFLHLYAPKEVRFIHGINKIKKVDMHVLGRSIQCVFN